MSNEQNSSSKRNGINVVFDESTDGRLDDIVPYVRALEFLRDDAKKNGIDQLYELIDSTFRIILHTYDLTEKQNKH